MDGGARGRASGTARPVIRTNQIPSALRESAVTTDDGARHDQRDADEESRTIQATGPKEVEHRTESEWLSPSRHRRLCEHDVRARSSCPQR